MKATESKYVFIKKKKQYVDSIGYIFSWWPFETHTSQNWHIHRYWISTGKTQDSVDFPTISPGETVISSEHLEQELHHSAWCFLNTRMGNIEKCQTVALNFILSSECWLLFNRWSKPTIKCIVLRMFILETFLLIIW